MSAPGARTADAEESVRKWLREWGGEVAAVDIAAARVRFADDLSAFGTRAEVVIGRDQVEDEQWLPTWPAIEDFMFLRRRRAGRAVTGRFDGGRGDRLDVDGDRRERHPLPAAGTGHGRPESRATCSGLDRCAHPFLTLAAACRRPPMAPGRPDGEFVVRAVSGGRGDGRAVHGTRPRRRGVRGCATRRPRRLRSACARAATRSTRPSPERSPRRCSSLRNAASAATSSPSC